MRFVKFLVFLLASIFLIWLVVFLMARALSGGSSGPVVEKGAELSSYQDSTAQMYIDGPIVSDQEHRAVRITVNQSESRIQTLTGYNGQVLEERSFPKTPASYKSFLKALEQAKFMDGDKGADGDERGHCAGQNRYVFRLDNDNSKVFRFWTTTCGGGTFAGSVEDVKWLFTNQIPNNDLGDLLNDLSMSL